MTSFDQEWKRHRKVTMKEHLLRLACIGAAVLAMYVAVMLLAGCGVQQDSCTLSYRNETTSYTGRCPMNSVVVGTQGSALVCAEVQASCPTK